MEQSRKNASEAEAEDRKWSRTEGRETAFQTLTMRACKAYTYT